MDTVMCGPLLTNTVFAYTVMQLVDQRKLTLDTPIKDVLEKPLLIGKIVTYGFAPLQLRYTGTYARWDCALPSGLNTVN